MNVRVHCTTLCNLVLVQVKFHSLVIWGLCGENLLNPISQQKKHGLTFYMWYFTYVNLLFYCGGPSLLGANMRLSMYVELIHGQNL